MTTDVPHRSFSCIQITTIHHGGVETGENPSCPAARLLPRVVLAEHSAETVQVLQHQHPGIPLVSGVFAIRNRCAGDSGNKLGRRPLLAPVRGWIQYLGSGAHFSNRRICFRN